ncbi:MAG TPA: hypothetical protein VL326_10640 [Kofleriaceae bacterium]|nr:hypothetical protein [Kofleriaceae bacterium]
MARAMLREGASIGQVMRHLASKMSSMRVLMRLAPIGLMDARRMAMAFEDGEENYEHMRLADLEYLARVIEAGGMSLVGSQLCDAIRQGHRQRFYARGQGHWLMRVTVDGTEPVCEMSSSLEELRAAIAEARWSEDVRLVRDERDLVVLEFPLVTAAS